MFLDYEWIFQGNINEAFKKFTTVHRDHIIEKKSKLDTICAEKNYILHYIVKDNHVNFFAISLFIKKSYSGAKLMLPVNQRNVRSSNSHLKKIVILLYMTL